MEGTAAVTFEAVTTSEIEGILALFQPVVNFFMGTLTTCVDFMMSNPFLMISLAVVTILAIIGVLVRLVHI